MTRIKACLVRLRTHIVIHTLEIFNGCIVQIHQPRFAHPTEVIQPKKALAYVDTWKLGTKMGRVLNPRSHSIPPSTYVSVTNQWDSFTLKCADCPSVKVEYNRYFNLILYQGASPLVEGRQARDKNIQHRQFLYAHTSSR